MYPLLALIHASNCSTRIARYSLPATDDEHFRLADACRLGDGYCIQAHMNGPYRFSVVKTPSGTVRRLVQVCAIVVDFLVCSKRQSGAISLKCNQKSAHVSIP